MVTGSVVSTEIDPVCHAACGSLRADPVVMFHPVSAASTGDSAVTATASAVAVATAPETPCATGSPSPSVAVTRSHEAESEALVSLPLVSVIPAMICACFFAATVPVGMAYVLLCSSAPVPSVPGRAPRGRAD